MNKISKYISSQFKNPRGIGGVIITFLQNRINKAMYVNAVAMVEVSENEKVLDIGYGNGFLLKKIYEKTRSELYGIDISDDAMEMAKKKNSRATKAGKLHLSVGDCCKLPYEDEAFDAVTSINTIYFWEDTIKGLEEIRRCLKPGKSFYNVVYTKEYLNTIKYTQIGYKKYEVEELIQMGKEAGYSQVEIKDIVKNQSLVVVYTR